MGSPELAQYADFYADHNARIGLTDKLSLWRDVSERLHQLTSEPEDVTYREVTANGVPGILVMPADSSTEHILLHSHSGGSVTSSMWQERKAVGHLAKAAGSRSLPEGQHNFFLGAGKVPEIDAAVSEMGAWLRSKIGLRGA